jgi:hypothetical protein
MIIPFDITMNPYAVWPSLPPMQDIVITSWNSNGQGAYRLCISPHSTLELVCVIMSRIPVVTDFKIRRDEKL